MSIKVPQETVQYQSHNHCQCDFCSSRRAVNAKKLSVSQRAAALQQAKQQSGCCCHCHDAANAATFAGSRGAFDPEHPAPVNQTALNASRGRTGAPNGSTANSQRQRQQQEGGAATEAPKRTKEEEEKEAMAELDRLERLLILEHKARINATLEADRIGALRGATNGSTRGGPQPLPAGYSSTSGQQQPHPHSFTGSGSNYRSGDAMFEGADVETIREAYELAHQCPVPPTAQCRSSHRLQDTMDGLRAVTMDPVNPAGRVAIQQVLHANGMAETPTGSASANLQQQQQGNGATEPEFGSSLAKNRTSHPHPQGAGLVWVNGSKRAAGDDAARADGSHMAATQYQTQADGTRAAKTATKTVTYAI